MSFVSDETGSVVAHYRYSAYGLDAVLGAADDPQRFAGRLELGDGLALLGARIYDRLTGRFLSQDPVFQELNPYSYTLGNPLDFWDPDGANKQKTVATWAAIAGVLGVVAVAAPGTAVAAAAGLTVAIVGAAIVIDMAIDQWAPLGLGSALGGFANFGSGPCKSKCGPAKQTKVVEITVGEGGGGATPPPPPAAAAPAPSCAPDSLASLPHPEAWLLLLVPAQLLLGMLWLRRRGITRGREATDD